MITENLSTLKIHKMSQEQYDRELNAGNIDPNALYLTPDTKIKIDSTLTVEGAAADAKAVGDAISQINPQDGVSPIVTTATINGGHRIVITDKEGEKTVDVMNGKDGRTAYDYAQDGGFTGTEQQFSAKLSMPIITPEMYGAKGDNVNDDSAAIQAAINAAGRDAVIYLGKKVYLTSSTLVLTKNRVKFVCDGVISYTGTGAAIKMESVGYADVDIYAIQAPNGTALLMDSTDGELGQNIISIKYILASVVGVHIKGDGANGASGHNIFYNKLHLEGSIVSTDTCIYIEPITALISENYFWVGRLYGGATYGIRINSTDPDGGNQVVGNAGRNIFHGGNFEGISDDGYSIYLHNSNLNVFHDFRTQEAYGKYVVGFSGQCYGNDIGVSRLLLKEVDTTDLTSTSNCPNILRSPQIAGLGDDNLSGLNKVWLSLSGFSSETSEITGLLNTETWIFTLSDGSTVEKQVVAS